MKALVLLYPTSRATVVTGAPDAKSFNACNSRKRRRHWQSVIPTSARNNRSSVRRLAPAFLAIYRGGNDAVYAARFSMSSALKLATTPFIRSDQTPLRTSSCMS